MQPRIIQGGMGVAVSGWQLARAVSQLDQLGVVSGTALAIVLSRRLQLGDPNGELQRALAHFPFPDMAERVMRSFHIPGGKAATEPFKRIQMPSLDPCQALIELTVISNFVEVFLAKEGHNGLVGINYLEKIQLPFLPSVYGAMLAGVDYVLMGAGIPRAVPGAIDQLVRGELVSMRIDVGGESGAREHVASFDPRAFCRGTAPLLKRPHFLGIVASATLALALARKASGHVDGFVIEGPTAGGHNAPPRGQTQLNAAGEPIYGPKDVPDLDVFRSLGRPFWLAGSYGRPGRLAEALSQGASGIQVGTAFAFCKESGICPELKRQVIEQSRRGEARVFTDPSASPAGFPFKVAQVSGTLSELEPYEARLRICDLGYLRQPYRKADGTIGYRCPAEPVEDYLRKGGLAQEVVGRKCICNSLPAAVGLGQIRPETGDELPMITAGDDLAHIANWTRQSSGSYTAADVVRMLLADAD